MFKKFLLALLCGVCAVSVMQAATPEAVARRQKFTAECGENADKAAVTDQIVQRLFIGNCIEIVNIHHIPPVKGLFFSILIIFLPNFL